MTIPWLTVLFVSGVSLAVLAEEAPSKSDATSLSTSNKTVGLRGIQKKTIAEGAERSSLLAGEWRCTLNQEMMKVESTETFFPDQVAKSEGRITFQWANDLKVEVDLKGESRWRLNGDQLCDVPRTMTFKSASESTDESIKTLIAAMQKQADQRATGNLETCRQIKTLNKSELVLFVASKTGTTETVCKPGTVKE